MKRTSFVSNRNTVFSKENDLHDANEGEKGKKSHKTLPKSILKSFTKQVKFGQTPNTTFG